MATPGNATFVISRLKSSVIMYNGSLLQSFQFSIIVCDVIAIPPAIITAQNNLKKLSNVCGFLKSDKSY